MTVYENAREMAMELGNMMNTGSHLAREAAQEVTNLHPVIQDLIVRWCIQILWAIASQDYYDVQNAAAVLFAQRMVEIMKNDGYAMIFR